MKTIVDFFKRFFTKKEQPVITSQPQPIPVIIKPVEKPIEKPVVKKDFLLPLGVSAFHNNLYQSHILQTLENYQINTPLRKAHFFAQILHESGSLRYTEELASGSAYEGRKDLGNTHPGDGVRYKGRGAVQITGLTNYSLYTNFCHLAKRYLDKDFVNNPELLKEPEFACDSAGYYWLTKKDKNGNNLNAFADEDNFIKITYFVNGGANGLYDRFRILLSAYKVFGVGLIPNRTKLIVAKLKETLESNDPNIGRMDSAFKKAMVQEGLNKFYEIMAKNGIQ
jgi:predicted chitinase